MKDLKAHTSVETFSLFGKPLYRTAPSGEALAQQEALYAKALEDFQDRPDDPDSLLWLGRRTAYMGRFNEAASLFSMGLEQYPENPKFYRHRGHRFITLRRFDLAVDDLEKAARLIEGELDEMEPPGTPNERNVGASSVHFNVWYHLGLAHYLKGEFDRALWAYGECMKVSETDDKLVATAHWNYMTHRRLGKKREPARLLDRIKPDMQVGENRHYYECLLMYKGRTSPDALMEKARKMDSTGLVTIGYGVGNWFLYGGQRHRAVEVFKEVHSSPAWAAFGYIAAEVELRRLGNATGDN